MSVTEWRLRRDGGVDISAVAGWRIAEFAQTGIAVQFHLYRSRERLADSETEPEQLVLTLDQAVQLAESLLESAQSVEESHLGKSRS